MPHAPLLLPSLSAHEEVASAAARVRGALADVAFPEAEVTVLLSHHGPALGFYRAAHGSLDAFGVRGVDAARDGDPDALETLSNATSWLVGEADHGVVVPLLLLGDLDGAVVAGAFPEALSPRSARRAAIEDAACRMTSAVEELAATRRVALVASAHGSGGLSPRAPLTELPGAMELELSLLDHLQRDAGAVHDVALDLWERGGSCSPGPLLVFASLFAGRAARLRAHEHPVGVSYVVATVGEGTES